MELMEQQEEKVLQEVVKVLQEVAKVLQEVVKDHKMEQDWLKPNPHMVHAQDQIKWHKWNHETQEVQEEKEEMEESNNHHHQSRSDFNC